MWVVSLQQGLLLFLFSFSSTNIVFTSAFAGNYAQGRTYRDNLTFAEWPTNGNVRRASFLHNTFWYDIAAFSRVSVTYGFSASVISNPASSPRRDGCESNSALFRLRMRSDSLSPQVFARQRLLYKNKGTDDLPPEGRNAIKTRRVSGEAAPSKSAAALQASAAAALTEHSNSKSAKTEDESNHCVSGRAKVISITTKARDRLRELTARQNSSEEGQNQKAGLILRLGVQSGGCSGLSYVLNIIDKAEITSTDFKEEFENEEGGELDRITVVVDPKSLLYVIGTVLDYNDDLIGGGFKVANPNASRSCGCGMSFGVPKTFAKHLIASKPMSCSSTRNTPKSASAASTTEKPFMATHKGSTQFV